MRRAFIGCIPRRVVRAHEAAAEDGATTARFSGLASLPNQWSMDFISDKLADGRSFRILTVVDQFTRECVGLAADRSMNGMKVAQSLERARAERGSLPESITVDNGSEFSGRALESWAMANEVQLCFIRAGPSGRERIHRELQ